MDMYYVRVKLYLTTYILCHSWFVADSKETSILIIMYRSSDIECSINCYNIIITTYTEDHCVYDEYSSIEKLNK